LYRTVPAGSGVGVGEGCFAAGTGACGRAGVDDVPAEQAPSEKSRNPTSTTRSTRLSFKRGDPVLERCVRTNSVCKARSTLAIVMLFLLKKLSHS
jgi:hypothetical protein